MKKLSKHDSLVYVPPLPFSKLALDPIISKETLNFHYDKHHKGYQEKTLDLIKGTELEGMALIPILRATISLPHGEDIFNNAAQVFNHNNYWESLSPKGGELVEPFDEMINTQYGSYEEFKTVLIETGTSHFGNGWLWITLSLNGKINIEATPNAALPLDQPLLVIDLWEHAYYLDYKNKRKEYLTEVIENLLNWEFAQRRYGLG